MMQNCSLIEALFSETEESKVVSVVGGGGKTSLIFGLAEEFLRVGKKVIVTTTTHMRYEPECPFAESADLKVVQKNLYQYGYTVVGTFDEMNKKIGHVSDEKLSELKKTADILLIEADGSKGLPLKVPESWEPALWTGSDVVIGVVGMDALGKRIGEICHRPEKTAAFLNKSLEDYIEEKDIVRIVESKDGMRKNVQENCKYYVFLNKTDIPGKMKAAETICRMLMNKNIQAVCGSLKEKRCYIHRSIAFVMLAAGKSSRFGSNKLLYEVEGKTMSQRTMEQLKKASEKIPGSRLIVVTRFEEILQKANQLGFQTLINEFPEKGISYSMKLGIEAAQTDACLFSVADQPWLTADTITALTESFFKEKKGMACLTDGHNTGNPCIFSRKYYEELMELSGDRGGKKIIKKYPEDVTYVCIENVRELQDIDKKTELSENIPGDKHDKRNGKN